MTYNEDDALLVTVFQSKHAIIMGIFVYKGELIKRKETSDVSTNPAIS